MKPMLIALYSPVMQSGKTEVANTLVASRGFQCIKFADGLKRVAAELLREVGVEESLIWRYLEGDLKAAIIPELGITGRQLMQRTGTDYGRNLINPMVWVRSTYRKLKGLSERGFNVVIDDLRHENELDMVLKVGGFPMRIHRPDAEPYAGHSSEGALDSHPMPTLVNQGTLDQLHQAALQVPEFLAAHYE